MPWEAIIALAAIAALALTVWGARRKTHEDVERLQFSLTPTIAVEGGRLEGVGARRTVTFTIHLEGYGFVHNLILNFFLGEEVDIINNPPAIHVWLFRRSPAAEEREFVFEVRDRAPTIDQTVRLEGRYENVFKQEIRFRQSGFLRATDGGLDFTSGAPEYSWPWATIHRGQRLNLGRLPVWH